MTRVEEDRAEPRFLTPALVDTAVKALASLVSLATLLALVTATGGAIVWLRFSAAELPAEHVLRLTPKDDLVGVGAVALGLFAVAGVAAVVVAYILDPEGAASTSTFRVLLTLAAFGMMYATYQLDRSWVFEAITAVAVVVLMAAVLFIFARWGRPVAEPGDAERDADERRRSRRLLEPAGGRFAVAALAVAVALAWWLVTDWFAIMIVVASVLVAVDFLLARETQFRFLWFGVAVFVSVTLFGGVLSVLLAYDAPKLQPAAVLRSSDQGPGGVAALYVAETSDRIYLAHVDPKCENGQPTDVPTRGTGRIFWIPRDDVIGVAIGTPQRLGAALARAPLLLEDLAVTRALASVQPAPQPPPAASQPPAPPPGTSPPTPPATTTPAETTAVVVTPPPPRRTLVRVCEKPRPLTPPFHGVPVEGEEALKVAQTFRPWLLFDSGERWRPLSVDPFLREQFTGRDGARHRLCSNVSALQAGCSDVDDVADFTASIQTPLAPERRMFLDINGVAVANYCGPDRCGLHPLDCDDCPSSAIYYRVSAANGRYYVDYWWFLRFNDVESRRARATCLAQVQSARCFDHEGDWEGITVVTSAQEPPTLEFASYAAHDGIYRYPRAKLRFRPETERPLVYIARGTHAAYPGPCPAPPARGKKCNQEVPYFGRVLPEGAHDGIAGWARNDEGRCSTGTACLLPFPAVADSAVTWHTWEGSWGSCHRGRRRCLLGQGPESPSNQRRFQNPTCFGPKKRVTCDPVTPDSRTVATG